MCDIMCDYVDIFSDRGCVRIFSIPTGLSGEAAHMLAEILQENHYRRPTADQCLQLDFIQGFILPKSLPVYCLLSEPRPEDIPFDDGRCTNFAHLPFTLDSDLIRFPFLQMNFSSVFPSPEIDFESSSIPCLEHARNEI